MLRSDPTAAGEPAVEETDGATAADAAQDGAVFVEQPDALAGAEELVEEPTVAGDLDAAALTALGVLPEPAAPPATVLRPVLGRYRSTGSPFQVELRVDVDGAKPTKRVSADYYSVSGATVTYYGSMKLDTPVVTTTATTVTITGTASYTWGAASRRIKVAIPRRPTTSTPAPATLQHLNAAGTPVATYICRFVSARFRTLMLEQDRQNTVASPFVSYNTGSLPSGGGARTLSIAAAYGEAGIELQSTGALGVVNTTDAGADSTWSDAELHSAMQRYFSLWRNLPQWAVWLFHADLHDLGPTLYGIMFDQQGRQRQGAAVFYRELAGTTADLRRLQLYTCVHELGHCFNLLHSWQKSYATPPAPNRPASPSWMNYPWRFPGGPAAFWSAFPFAFDNLELVHLRHAYRDNVIMGGKPFATGAALEGPEDWREPEVDASGLRFDVVAPRSLPLGAPVSVDLRLTGTTSPGRPVARHLRPRNGNVELAIRQPGGRVLHFRPLLQHCAADTGTTVLGADDPPLVESAFIHYGQDGIYFDQTGTYLIRARYVAPDGSLVLSNVARLRVRSPLDAVDDHAAELMLGEDQGVLLALVGSDDPSLRAGNEAFAELVDRYPEHPLALYARVALGTNAARAFKRIDPAATNAPDGRGSVDVRPPQPEEAVAMLEPVLDVDALRSTAAAREGDPHAMMIAAARDLRELGPRREVPPDVRAYLRARRREIAVEVATELS
jgi:hypothetical protein